MLVIPVHIHLFIFLENNIVNFLKFYQTSFPLATVIHKMHILEDHVLSWFRRWRLGFGLMGGARGRSNPCPHDEARQSVPNTL